MSRYINADEVCNTIDAWVQSHGDNPTHSELEDALDIRGWSDGDMMISDAIAAGSVFEKDGKLYTKGVTE